MPNPRSINPVFEHLDKDLIFRWTSTGNQLLFDRSVNAELGLPWGTPAPVHLIIDDSTVGELAGVWFSSHIVHGSKQWDDLDVKNVAVDTPSSVLLGAALSVPLLMDNIDTPQIITRLHALARAHFEDSKQTNIQDEVEEIKDWYAAKVSNVLEAKALLYKQDAKNIEFVVVVDHICRDHSFQLSDLACELDDLYPHWDFGFQYVSIRTAGQLPLDEYSDLINDG